LYNFYAQWPWSYSHSDLPTYFHEIWSKLGWDQFDVIAHSFSGNAMTPYLAACDDSVTSFIILDAYGLVTVKDENSITLHKKKMDAALKGPIKKSHKFLPRDELRTRLKKSTIPEEFQNLWMERGVIWNDDRTAGYFSRDLR